MNSYFSYFSSRQTGSTWVQGPDTGSRPDVTPPPPPAPPSATHHLLDQKDPVQAPQLQTALPGSLCVNTRPSLVHSSGTGECVLSFCFNPREQKTGIWRHVVELLAPRPLYTKTFNELNGFPSAGLKIQTCRKLPLDREGGGVVVVALYEKHD